SFPLYIPELRLATLGPGSGVQRVGQLVKTLRDTHQPGDRKEYVPPYKGFAKVFGVPLVAAAKDAHIRWSDDLMALGPEGTPTQRLMHGVRAGINQLSLARHQFDVALVHLPDAWEIAFRGIGFDAHDSIKAIAVEHGIPTQIINDR